MDDSILVGIKKLLGAEPDDTDYDLQISMHINSALAVCTQLGIGPKEGFRITGNTETWSDFLGDDTPAIGLVQEYVYAKVKLVFDPPQNSATLKAFEDICKEFEWRGNVHCDKTGGTR